MKYKIGLDIHGVIDKFPGIFSFLSDSIIKNGGEVHIITGGTWTKKLVKKLESYNIKWTNHFSVYDYMIKNFKPLDEPDRKFPDGTIQKNFKNEEWDKIKGQYCENNKISLHIDDMDSYYSGFKTPFILMKKMKK